MSSVKTEYSLSSFTPRGCGHCRDSYCVLPKDALKIATLWPGKQTRLMISFSHATLLLNSSETTKLRWSLINRQSLAASRRAKRNYVRGTLLYEVYFISEQPGLSHRLVATEKKGEKKRRNFSTESTTDRKFCDSNSGRRRFLRTGVSSRRNRRCLLVSLRHVAFANFNEPE